MAVIDQRYNTKTYRAKRAIMEYIGALTEGLALVLRMEGLGNYIVPATVTFAFLFLWLFTPLSPAQILQYISQSIKPKTDIIPSTPTGQEKQD